MSGLAKARRQHVYVWGSHMSSGRVSCGRVNCFASRRAPAIAVMPLHDAPSMRLPPMGCVVVTLAFDV